MATIALQVLHKHKVIAGKQPQEGRPGQAHRPPSDGQSSASVGGPGPAGGSRISGACSRSQVLGASPWMHRGAACLLRHSASPHLDVFTALSRFWMVLTVAASAGSMPLKAQRFPTLRPSPRAATAGFEEVAAQELFRVVLFLVFYGESCASPALLVLRSRSGSIHMSSGAAVTLAAPPGAKLQNPLLLAFGFARPVQVHLCISYSHVGYGHTTAMTMPGRSEDSACQIGWLFLKAAQLFLQAWNQVTCRFANKLFNPSFKACQQISDASNSCAQRAGFSHAQCVLVIRLSSATQAAQHCTTLDLSQKAEKGMPSTVLHLILAKRPRKEQPDLSNRSAEGSYVYEGGPKPRVHCCRYGLLMTLVTLLLPFYIGAAVTALLFPLFVLVACHSDPPAIIATALLKHNRSQQGIQHDSSEGGPARWPGTWRIPIFAMALKPTQWLLHRLLQALHIPGSSRPKAV
eukprot:1142999-Pelagomonas_calceolata.AAC.2